MVIGPAEVSSTARYARSASTRLGAERLGLRRRRVANLDRGNLDALVDDAFGRRGRLGNLLHDIHAFGDPAEDSELPAQRRLVGHADEELRAAAVRLVGLQHRGDRAARRRLAVDLGPQHTQSSGAIKLRLRRILRERIAALDDPQPDHPVKRRPLVGPLARQLDEVADVVRREIGPQVDDERPGRRVNDRLLVGHLGEGQGVLERRRSWLGGLGQ